LRPREKKKKNTMSYFILPLFTKKAEDIDIYSLNVAYHTTMPNAIKFFAKSI